MVQSASADESWKQNTALVVPSAGFIHEQRLNLGYYQGLVGGDRRGFNPPAVPISISQVKCAQ